MNCRYGDIKVGSATGTGATLILSIGILFFIVHADKTNNVNSDPPGVFHAGRIVLKPILLWEEVRTYGEIHR